MRQNVLWCDSQNRSNQKSFKYEKSIWNNPLLTFLFSATNKVCLQISNSIFNETEGMLAKKKKIHSVWIM